MLSQQGQLQKRPVIGEHSSANSHIHRMDCLDIRHNKFIVALEGNIADYF